jgi:hypothetical protein
LPEGAVVAALMIAAGFLRAIGMVQLSDAAAALAWLALVALVCFGLADLRKEAGLRK